MNKAVKSFISVIMVLLVLFMLTLACFGAHEHICDHTTCTQCELLRSLNDFLSLLFVLIFIFLAGIITYFQVTEAEKMPMALYVFVMGVFIVPMVSVIINLVTRIKEIKGGEEDEASKY